MPAVKIPAQRSGWLGFDLADLLAVIGEHADLSWQVVDARFAFEDQAISDSWQAIAYDSRLSGGVDITWEQLEKLACAGGQIVEGQFTGFDGNTAIVQLALTHGSYWVVWARTGTVLERLWGAFAGVEDCDVRVPHR